MVPQRLRGTGGPADDSIDVTVANHNKFSQNNSEAFIYFHLGSGPMLRWKSRYRYVNVVPKDAVYLAAS